MKKYLLIVPLLALPFVFMELKCSDDTPEKEKEITEITDLTPEGTKKEGTWRRFDTITETFKIFMGDKYDSSMSLIANVNVCSETEAILVSNSSGVSLTYTERTIFIPSGLFSTSWGPMRRRYPIEMWTELRGKTNDGIRQWITGGDRDGAHHGDRDGDLIWIIENGILGMGAATGWGFDIEKYYQIGGGATINCTVIDNDYSYIMTITIPLDNDFRGTGFFTLNEDSGELSAEITFNSIVSSIMKTSKFFKSDAFIMQLQ
jgi:hypothetical protein